jgi:hypothetical protein
VAEAEDIEEIEQAVELVERVAAIDIAKASGMVCVRLPHEDKPGFRTQHVFNTVATSGAILDLADHLICQGVTRVVMEATPTYWKPYFFLLESRGLECWPVNARDVKNVPGRPKTDRLDAVWLAKLTERDMLRPSFVPPKPVRELRDPTRARAVMTHERTRHKQRTEKLIEDAQIKLSTVRSVPPASRVRRRRRCRGDNLNRLQVRLRPWAATAPAQPMLPPAPARSAGPARGPPACRERVRPPSPSAGKLLSLSIRSVATVWNKPSLCVVVSLRRSAYTARPPISDKQPPHLSLS